MAYENTPGAGLMRPPTPPLQTSANFWRNLQIRNASLGRQCGGCGGVRVRMGAVTVILPSFTRAKTLGQDESLSTYTPLFNQPSDASEITGAYGLAPVGGSTDLSSIYSELGINPTPAPDATLYEAPSALLTNEQQWLAVPGGGVVNTDLEATAPLSLPASSSPALDSYNQALSNALGQGMTTAQAIAQAAQVGAAAGLTAAQIQALNKQAPAAAAAVTSTGLLPGISNTALIVGGGIFLIVLASIGSKKRR